MSGVELKASVRDGHVVVVLRGDLDVTGVADAEAAITALVTPGQSLIIDMSALDSWTGAALGALLRMQTLARRGDGDVVLAAPQRQVLRLLAPTRKDDGVWGPASRAACSACAASRPQSHPLPRPGGRAWPARVGGADRGDEERSRRWPASVRAARQLGARAVFAFPLIVGAIRAGVLGLYRGSPGPLPGRQFGDLLILADAATVMLLGSVHGHGEQEDGAGRDGQAPDPPLHRAQIDHAT